jgi:hypothetical protein
MTSRQDVGLVAVVRWMSAADAVSSAASSVSCYNSVENIRVLAIVESKRKLVEIKRKVLRADLVVVANDGTLQQTPERFNRLRVNLAANVLIVAVVQVFVRQVFAQIAIVIRFIVATRLTLSEMTLRTNFSRVSNPTSPAVPII